MGYVRLGGGVGVMRRGAALSSLLPSCIASCSFSGLPACTNQLLEGGEPAAVDFREGRLQPPALHGGAHHRHQQQHLQLFD